MNIIQKLWLSIIRRKSKSIILYLIVFLLGNFLCASIAIKTSIEKLQEDFKNQLGNKIEIILNDEQNYLFYENEEFQKELVNLISNLENMENKDYFKYFDNQYLLYGLYSDKLTYSNQYLKDHFCYYPDDLIVYGISEDILVDQIEQKIDLISGRMFTREEIENGSKVVLLSDCFKYEGKSISVGDKININKVVIGSDEKELYNESTKYEVVGIYSKNESLDTIYSYTYDNYSTRVYMPYTTAINEYEELKRLIKNNDAKDFSLLRLQRIALKLSNTKYEKYFEKQFNYDNELIKENIYQIITSEDIYKKIAVPVETLKSISNLMEMISFNSIIVLLSISIFIFIKERRYEIGILYSIGQKKFQIIQQFILENLIIILISITMAMFSGYQLGNCYVNYVFKNQVDNEQYIYSEEYSQEELLNKYQVEFDKGYVFNVYLSVIIITILCSALSIVYILRLNPKKILM